MIKYLVPEISLGNWITIAGGIIVMAFAAGIVQSEIAQAREDIEKNEAAIEKIIDLKQMVTRLETRQEEYSKQMETLVSLIREDR